MKIIWALILLLIIGVVYAEIKEIVLRNGEDYSIELKENIYTSIKIPVGSTVYFKFNDWKNYLKVNSVLSKTVDVTLNLNGNIERKNLDVGKKHNVIAGGRKIEDLGIFPKIVKQNEYAIIDFDCYKFEYISGGNDGITNLNNPKDFEKFVKWTEEQKNKKFSIKNVGEKDLMISAIVLLVIILAVVLSYKCGRKDKKEVS